MSATASLTIVRAPAGHESRPRAKIPSNDINGGTSLFPLVDVTSWQWVVTRSRRAGEADVCSMYFIPALVLISDLLQLPRLESHMYRPVNTQVPGSHARVHNAMDSLWSSTTRPQQICCNYYSKLTRYHIPAVDLLSILRRRNNPFLRIAQDLPNLMCSALLWLSNSTTFGPVCKTEFTCPASRYHSSCTRLTKSRKIDGSQIVYPKY